jgi:outer membrane protein OmpA-like peptidoglycan-associated protein
MQKLTVAILATAFMFAGCAGPGMQADKTITDSRQALNEAYSKKLNKECPEAFKAAEKTFKEAVALYKKCKCAKALAMAEKARAELKALCPVTEEPASAPAPAPVAAPADSDHDGVIDSLDRCPGTPEGADVNKVGCWIIKGLLFDFAKADIKPMYEPFLQNVIRVLTKNPEMLIEIQGHTDAVGSEAFNMKLSMKRAQAVADYLTAHGIAANRLTVTGFGESRPCAPNDTDEGRAQNRRVQIKARN